MINTASRAKRKLCITNFFFVVILQCVKITHVSLLYNKVKMKEIVRCEWCGTDSLMIRYHDEEWGAPVHDDRRLFEFLVLEGAQAGLSWSTILNKRDNYRRAFARFDPEKVARFGAPEVRKLLADAGIVRNRLKIESAMGN